LEIPCVIVRGGTSKGVYIRGDDLPEKAEDRDAIIASIFGSPDRRQINGLGGGDPLTSKVAILTSVNRSDSDVGYLSGEVRLGCSEINYGIMCGNLASGVGLAAYHLNLLDSCPIDGAVRIFNENTSAIIHAAHNDFSGGTVGQVCDVKLTFFSSCGATTGKLLPTDQPVDVFTLDGNAIGYSVVDAGAIYTFIQSDAFSLSGYESVDDLNANCQLRNSVEEIRSHVSGEINRLNPHLSIHSGQIKVALVSSAADITPADRESNQADIVARIVNPQGVHHAYAVSGAICCCTASAIDGTIVNQLTRTQANNPSLVIAHPEGFLEVSVEMKSANSGESGVLKASIERTARVIMTGTAYAAH
jgi:methylitaconate Delta-isomerase